MAEPLSTILNALVAAGMIGAVVVALWLGLKQRSADREALYNSQRPIIVPTKATFKRQLTSTEQDSLLVDSVGFKFNEPYYLIELRNVGPGAALNVDGILTEPQPEQPTPTLAQSYRLHVNIPIASEATAEVSVSPGGTLLHGTAEIVPGYQLYAPQASSEADRRLGVGAVSARFTLTCSDIFGKVHAFVYDYTEDSRWVYRISQRVENSIGDHDRDANRQLIPGPSDIPTSLEDYKPKSE